VADCPRKKAAETRRRADKERWERQGQDRAREQLGRRAEQERRAGNSHSEGRAYTHKQIKEKIKSLEKWRRKNGSLSAEDGQLLGELSDKVREMGVKAKKEKEVEEDELQKKSFEAAVNNAGTEVMDVQKATAESPVAPGKHAKKKMRDARILENIKATNKAKEPMDQLRFPKESCADNGYVDNEVDSKEEASNKPSVQESLNKIKIRKELKKQASIQDAKSFRSPRKSQGSTNENKPDTIKQFRKKQDRKEREDKEKEKKSMSKDNSKECDTDPDSLDYNTIQRREVLPGTVDYYAPLTRKNSQSTAIENKSEQKQLEDLNRSRLEENKQNRKERRKTKMKGNKEKKKSIQGDESLIHVAETYLVLKACQEAEAKYNRFK
jgi:hypothetical protein